MSETQTPPAPPAAGKAAAPAPLTYPATLYQPIIAPPGFKSVIVTDEASRKALRPPGFVTKMEALDYNAPLEQPIPHITRTANEEQWDDRKSQRGQDVAAGVIRTEAPVQNVFVQTGIDPTTLAITAQLPEGVTGQAITAQSEPGAVIAPPRPDTPPPPQNGGKTPAGGTPLAGGHPPQPSPKQNP